MADKSIIIIGAGIAGLSAGCYGQMNGYRTRIFELHTAPGGLCTSWGRKGYTFDGCIHWLVGTAAHSNFNRIWQELGAVQNRPVVDHDEFVRVEGPGGKAFVVYTDVDRLEKHMLELAPGDAGVIRELTQGIRQFGHFDPPLGKPRELYGLLDFLKMIPMLPAMGSVRKYIEMPVQTFAARFTDPFLRESFLQVFDLPDFPMLAIMATLGYMNDHNAGYPIGGSLAFSRAIERRCLDLGGEINYKARVGKILVEDNRAVGVQLADGTQHRADVVISAADGHATIFDMLEGKYIDDEIRGYYDHLPIFAPIIQVSLGVGRDLSGLPHQIDFGLDRPITIAGQERRRLSLKHYCYDSSLAPTGKSVVSVMLPSNYDYWKQLAEDPEQYEVEKKQIALTIIEQLDRRVPGFGEQVEVADVATPLTYERYTGNWRGSMEGWLISTKTMKMSMLGKGMSKTLPGLENFYMIGQWVEPGGGVPTAAMSARNVLQIICHRDKRPFVTSIPS